MAGVRRISLELPAQLTDVSVDRPADDVGAIAPHFLQQLDSFRYSALSPEECEQELVFLWPQCNRRSAAKDVVRSGQDFYVTEPEPRL